MIKKKTKAFVDNLIAHPTKTATQAYLDTHETENRPTARVNASQLLAKPDVLEYLALKAPIAEQAIFQVLQNSKKRKDNPVWQRLALDSAQSVLDRTYGKPLTRTISAQTNINIEASLNSLE